MYHLILLALLGSVAAIPAPSTNQIARNDDLAAAYVLPTTTFPTFYDVRLFIDPGFVDYFYGNVSIRIIANEATNEIVMQAMEMEIQNIRVYSDTNEDVDFFESFTLADDDTHILRITLNENLLVLTPYVVHIDYVGQYATNMFGLYVSTYEDDNGDTINLVTSQLQPTFGRRTFPCYDEPASKAVFRTTIYAPPEYAVVRSNMPSRAENVQEEVAGWTKHEFEDTLVMSTYLLAYLVSNFDFIDNDNNPLYRIPFRVYSRPGTQENADFALDFGQRNMAALEEFTNFPYYFPKLDKVAVPDFGAGAMENWGLVIYREVALLVQEGVTTTAVLQNIGRIISHENAHQWFGNEVGPESWTYTWLNEGFANFFEAFATDLVLPEWRMMDQYVCTTLQGVFQSDAVLTVNSMTHAVYTPSEIISTFNSVAYQKSGSVIRMMQHFLTPEIFRQGLVYYIQNMSRRAAVPADLFSSLQQALDESNHSIPYPLATVMNLWTNQGGFPVLTIRRTAPSSNSIQIDQERYLTDRSLSSANRWHVPVNWVLSTNPDFTDTSPQGWVPTTFPVQSYDIPGLSNAEWYLVNKQQTGYYRVNYEDSNWAALANVLNTSPQTIHLLNRAQLVDDSFNLARNGRLSYEYPLEISRYLIQESDYIPWASANAALTFLDNVLGGSSAHELFSRYVLYLTAPLYESLGFTASPTEEHVTPFHRTIILNFNCRLGNDDCVSQASQMLQSLRNDPEQVIDPDLQTTIFCSGLRGGDVDNFNFLWNRYLTSQDSSEQSILMNALGCTTNPETRDFYLSQVTSDDSAVREQDRHTVLVATINGGSENMEVAFDFVLENFLQIQPRVQGLSGTTNILNALANRLTTSEHAAKIEDFATRYAGSFTAGEQASVAFIRENIAAAITWNDVNYAQVESWLTTNFSDEEEEEDNGANTIGAGVAVVASIVVAVYNLI